MRTAAGRRVLHVALLLGGLFVLGFFCGEQAHAAEDATPVERVAGMAPSAASAGPEARTHLRSKAPDAVRHAVESVARRGVRPADRHAVDPVVRPVVDPFIRPVGQLLGEVRDGLADPPRHGLPGFPGLSAPQFPAGLPAGAPPMTSPSPGETADRPTAAARQVADHAGPSHHAAYGPLRTDAAGVPAGVTRHTPVLAAVGHAPLPAGGGAPYGALGGQSAIDAGSPRHGDPHAATFDARAPFRLLSVGTAATVVGPTRDRHRDIPEFPG